MLLNDLRLAQREPVEHGVEPVDAAAVAGDQEIVRPAVNRRQRRQRAPAPAARCGICDPAAVPHAVPHQRHVGVEQTRADELAACLCRGGCSVREPLDGVQVNADSLVVPCHLVQHLGIAVDDPEIIRMSLEPPRGQQHGGRGLIVTNSGPNHFGRLAVIEEAYPYRYTIR